LVLGVDCAPGIETRDSDVPTFTSATVCAFIIAMEKRLGEEPPPQTVRDFVARARGTWIKPEGLNPVLAERVILDVFEDEDLTSDVLRSDILRTQTVLAYAATRELGITGPAFEEFLDEVEELMNEPIAPEY